VLTCSALLSGGTPKTDHLEYWDGNVSWASAKDVSQCGQTFLTATERKITDAGLAESATQLIPRFATVVVARGATTGRMVLFGHPMAMNQTCYALVTTREAPFHLYCQLRHEIDDLVHAAHGSVFDTITTTTFESSRVVLAPTRATSAFEAATMALFRRVLANTEQSRTHAALRDTLLPKLISGEIRVKDAERFVEKAI
jgi:type I restriction enzyme, S subunit